MKPPRAFGVGDVVQPVDRQHLHLDPPAALHAGETALVPYVYDADL
jgi:hypothetical protein